MTIDNADRQAALLLLVAAPMLVLTRGFGGDAYPSAPIRLWVLRPFWYAQLALPEVTVFTLHREG